MRSITKTNRGGLYLQQSHNNPPTTKEQATSSWRNFRHKANITNSLVREQYALCAYSEIRPDKYDLGTHIEHLEPKSQNPQRTFDYSNLVLSALSSEDLKNRGQNDVFGGHAKQSGYDANLFVSCLQANCASYFVYLSNGLVEPSHDLNSHDHQKAQYTINLLNLNSPYLVTQRKNWLNELDQLIDEYIKQGWSLLDLASIDLIPANNELSQFFTATRQRFANVAEQVLRQHAPGLI